MNRSVLVVVVLGAWALGAAVQHQNHGSQYDNRKEEMMLTQDEHGAMHTGPTGFKLELENDSVQVVRISIGPHQKVPMHEVTPRVIVFLSDEDLRLTFPDGETKEEHHRAGETSWLPAQKHAGENLGDKPIEFIAVIPKNK